MLKKIVFLSIICLILIGCAKERMTEWAYFDGSVVVQHKHYNTTDKADRLTFNFPDKDVYSVFFSLRPWTFSGAEKFLPQPLLNIDGDNPLIIEQREFPPYFSVTLIKGSKYESHDF